MRKFKFVGELPANGEWRFLLVAIAGQADVVLIVDRTGKHAPRMVVGEKLVTIRP